METETITEESVSSSRATLSEWLLPVFAVLILYLPTYIDLANTIWASDEQGHGPIILGISLWFFWRNRVSVQALPVEPARITGWVLFLAGLLMYALGRSQGILLFEVGSQIIVISSVLLLMRGLKALKTMWFPLFFLLFMIPLPASIVDLLTLPMKTVVSWAVDNVLYWAGYPISRSGVILQMGHYKLLVADACAGLHTLFTLEAMGLFYLHLVRHESWARNTLLAITIVPISLTANTIRVTALALITYHFGDEAGQGFLHGFAGMVLFISALILIIGVDSLIQFCLNLRSERKLEHAEA